MTTTHLVVGAGPVGTAIARELAALGHEVRLASRSGRGPGIDGVSRVAVDATDAAALTALARGVDVIYNALNPSRYHEWPVQWPPMWRALMTAAEDTGALLAIVSNLYGYGLPDGPMTESTPLRPADTKGEIRASQWEEALAAHEAGRIRVVEVRGSDYLGAGAQSVAALGVGAVLAGKQARVVGRADLPHSWTYTGDVGRTVVAAALDPSAHGRVWHVPSNPPRTQRELLTDVAALAGVGTPRISQTPPWVLRLIGLVRPEIGAAARVAYQFTHPFVLDDTAARARFGIEPAPWEDVLLETVAHIASLSGTPAVPGTTAR